MRGPSSFSNNSIKTPFKHHYKASRTGLRTSVMDNSDKVPDSVLDWYNSMIMDQRKASAGNIQDQTND